MLCMRPPLNVNVAAIGQFLADVIPAGGYELANILAICNSSGERVFCLVTSDRNEVWHKSDGRRHKLHMHRAS
jgi:hypothetical protein